MSPLPNLLCARVTFIWDLKGQSVILITNLFFFFFFYKNAGLLLIMALHLVIQTVKQYDFCLGNTVHYLTNILTHKLSNKAQHIGLSCMCLIAVLCTEILRLFTLSLPLSRSIQSDGLTRQKNWNWYSCECPWLGAIQPSPLLAIAYTAL